MSEQWCRFNSVNSIFINPGSPWQKGWIESFNGRLRDELLNAWTFDNLLETQFHVATALHVNLRPRRRRDSRALQWGRYRVGACEEAPQFWAAVIEWLSDSPIDGFARFRRAGS